MSEPMVSMQVDPAMVKGIVLKEIQAAVVAQLNQAPMMIENVVKLALSAKTNAKLSHEEGEIKP